MRVREHFGEAEQSAKRYCNEITRSIDGFRDASADHHQVLKAQFESSSHSMLDKLHASESTLVQIKDSSQQSLQLLIALLSSEEDSERYLCSL